MHEQKLLDIGCGTGTFLERIKGNAQEAVGLEYNDGMIGEAQKRIKDVKLVQGPIDTLPFVDTSFDVCTINRVIHHFPMEEQLCF